MSSAGAIPRFLLPKRGAIWQPFVISRFVDHSVRNASTKAIKKGAKPASSKPLVLEKPAKFNPPSHGAKLRKEAPRYPGPDLSAEEKERMQTKKYPNMMPPERSFMYWFLHNRGIHLIICLGTLFALALTVSITNFKRTSPFAEMLPSWTQLFVHPFRFMGTCIEVLKLHQAKITAETMEKRQQKVDDVAKRSAYRKAHGIEHEGFLGGWTAKTEPGVLVPGVPMGEDAKAAEVATEAEVVTSQVPREKKVVKKWLGIWA